MKAIKQHVQNLFSKSTLTFLLVLLSCLNSSAQTSTEVKEPKDELLFILNEMRNEFSGLLGAVESRDTVDNYTNYTPLNRMSSSECVITEIMDADKSTRKALVYFYDFEKTDGLIGSMKYLTPLLDIVNARIQLGMYKGRDYKNDAGRSVTEVTDLEGNYLIDIVSSGDWGLKLVFYSKNWGKN